MNARGRPPFMVMPALTMCKGILPKAFAVFGIRGKTSFLARLLALLFAVIAGGLLANPAQAQNCQYATSQGATGPANWQTYCWLDLNNYNNTAARSASGQNMSYTLPDGTVMTFTLRVSGAAAGAAASPSWTGAAVGNTAFLGIGGRPIFYQSAAGTTTVSFSNIVLTPPSGSQAITSYMFVVGDGESSNGGESIQITTNGGAWQLLDLVGPVSGSTYPTVSGVNTNTATVTGVGGTLGAHIFGSSTPTSVTATMVGSGLQGLMFAVRFASIRLTQQITATRINAADQFTFDIRAASNGAVLASGTTSGSGLGPFTAAALSSSSALPLHLVQTMAGGSASAQGQYRTLLTCTNAVSSSTALPTNVETVDFNLGALQFGDNVSCVFTSVPRPHLQLSKALGSFGRRFSSDQFILRIDDSGGTTVATTTTSGTGTTVINGSTTLTQVNAGTVYTLYELGAGSTALDQYNATMSCTNAWTGSSTPLPTSASATITPQFGDIIRCTITNVRRGNNATLSIEKTSSVLSDPVNGASSPFHLPGALVRYELRVQNSGNRSVDSNSVVLIDALPADIVVGTAANPTFTQGSPTSNLTFNAANDVRYSNAPSQPTSFAACNYTPIAAFDPAVRFICINPKGTMAASTGTPRSFTVSFTAQIR